MIQITAKDGSARPDPKKWIDVKVALSTSDALTRSFIVILDAISEHASMRYRKVDVDGFRDIRGKPVDALVNLQQGKGEQYNIHLLALHKLVAIKHAPFEREIGFEHAISRRWRACL
jgi:hypothetical protein